MKRLLVLALVLITSMVGSHTTFAKADVKVDCASNPAALGPALAAASPGDTLKIDGTCRGIYTITKNLTLDGKGSATLDGNGTGPVITVNAGVQVVLDSLTVTGGRSNAPIAVGGILNQGTLSLIRSRVTNNGATGVSQATGGIASLPLASAILVLDRSQVDQNSAQVTATVTTTAAGGLRTEGSVTISRSEINNNRALATSTILNRAFGATVFGPGEAVVDKSTFNGNLARSEHTGTAGSGLVAGAIGGVTRLPGPGHLTIRDSSISRNQAFAVSIVGSGAAGGMVARQTTLEKSEVSSNRAEAGTFAAAGIAHHDSDLTLDKTDVKGNIAIVTEASGLAGGGMISGYLGPAVATLSNSNVTNNTATGGSVPTGGIHKVPVNGTVNVDKTDVRNNQPNNCNFVAIGCQAP